MIQGPPPCAECGATTTRLTTGGEIYPHRKDLEAKRFWKCECGAYCGCHPNSSISLGYPCGPETRKARQRAHARFDPLWRNRGEMRRAVAYAWLSKELGIPADQCHIGMMNLAQAEAVIAACIRRKEAREEAAR